MKTNSASVWRALLLVTALFSITYSVHAQTWSTPQTIENNDGNVNTFDLAVAPNGDAIAVWQQFDGTRYNLWASNFSNSRATWTAPTLIENIDTGNAQAPRVAIAANGSAAVVWQQLEGSGTFGVWANRFFPNTGWGTAKRIQTAGFSALAPQVAVDSHGFAIAVWPQADGTGFSIVASQAIGDQWSAPQLLETSSISAMNPRIAIDEFDNAIVTWEQSDGSRTNVFSNRYEWNGQHWATATLLASGNNFAFDTQIITNASGSFQAIYRRQPFVVFGSSPVSLSATSFQDAAISTLGWPSETPLSGNVAFAVGFGSTSMNASGDAFTVWVGDQSSLWANRFSARVWSAPVRISSTAGNVAGPAVAIAPNGNAVSVWMQSDTTTSNYNLLASRFTPGTGWGTPQSIEFDTASAFNPKVGVNANGRALVVWAQSDGTRTNLLWSRSTAL